MFSAAGVLASVAAIVIGLEARQHADVGAMQSAKNAASVERMLASNSDDVNVPAGDYFYDVSRMLKEQYVEPVTDDQKLADGAVRGMITSLGDPQSLYLDKNQFQALLNAREGKFEGIGADFALISASKGQAARTPGEPAGSDATAEDAMVTVTGIPRLEVVSVVPGGPADRAGVKLGDIAVSVDDHWIVNSELIQRFRDAQKQFLAKKLPLSGLNVLRNEIRSKAEHAIMPLRAKDQLFMGKAGNVTVVWNRGGVERKTKIVKAPSALPGFSARNGEVNLPFVPSSAAKLKEVVAGRKAITLDLRNNTMGDMQSMKQCMEVLVPKGQYGRFTTFRKDSPTPLLVHNGNSDPPKITLVTDLSTRGAAEVFALALSSRGFAKLSGAESGGDRDSKTIVRMPDGSGYTLVTSVYHPTLGNTEVARKGRRAMNSVGKACGFGAALILCFLFGFSWQDLQRAGFLLHERWARFSGSNPVAEPRQSRSSSTPTPRFLPTT